MKARESVLETPELHDLKELFPIMQDGMSDSATLDNVFEFLTMAGMSMPNVLSALIPESWNNKNPIPDSLKAYYEYNSILMEPWDGPATVLFTDGRYAGGMLDRNGLRPARYSMTKDGIMILASESGVIQIPDDDLEESGRLMPGKMMLIDTQEGRVIYDREIKDGFATAPMVAMGCIMCRKCQTNTCPVGIATQDPAKRSKFRGTPENVMNYFRFVAEDVRTQLAQMGFRSLDEIIGRADLIVRKPAAGRKSDLADISGLIAMPEGDRTYRDGQPDILGEVLDKKMIKDANIAMDAGDSVKLEYGICNVDRSVGAMLSGEVTKRGLALKDNAIQISFKGTAGQSFGAFLSKSMTFYLNGQANDFVGKGLSGGRLAVYHSGHVPRCNVIAGNTVLYGATSGEAYIAGSVGERFCVRNSGAVAVAEGAGDHCCEYMTGGRVVILGKVGRNFAAGMSAGIAYVINDDGDLDRHCNMGMVELLPMDSAADGNELRGILEDHLKYTGSEKAKAILDDWENSVTRFLKIIPIEYEKILHSKD